MMTKSKVDLPTQLCSLFRRVGGALCLLLISAGAFAADTTPAAKIVEMDVYGTYGGTRVFVRLDPAVTVTTPGFTDCTAPNNFYLLSTSTDADRAVLAQLQMAYGLKKNVVLHVVSCTTISSVDYPVGIGARTY